jgi:hypothetical protein
LDFSSKHPGKTGWWWRPQQRAADR